MVCARVRVRVCCSAGLVDSLDDPELEADLRAAAFVTHGGLLHKWRKGGREKPHRRFVRVACGASSLSGRRLQVVLHWDKKSEEVVRADDEIYESCFQVCAVPRMPPQ